MEIPSFRELLVVIVFVSNVQLNGDALWLLTFC